MARIRTIKPEFFVDEDLATLHFASRLAFIGLWCHADREGRLEDRPGRLKAQILPHDQAIEGVELDFDAILDDLASENFIKRYIVAGKKFLQIRNFIRYQYINPREPRSEIPPPPVSDESETSLVPVSARYRTGILDNGRLIKTDKRRIEPTALVDESSTRPRPEVTIPEIVDAWKRVCVPLGAPDVREITTSRERKLRLRIREHPTFAWWDELFSRIGKSRFLFGDGSRGWRVSLDWIAENDRNALKILEGKYEQETTRSR